MNDEEVKAIMEKKEMMNVDYELVRTLRRNGYAIEANELIRAWQNSIKKNWKEGRREIININQKIRNTIKRRERNNEQDIN